MAEKTYAIRMHENLWIQLFDIADKDDTSISKVIERIIEQNVVI